MSGTLDNVDELRARVDALTDLVRSIEDDNYPEALDYVQALRMIAQTAESALPFAVQAARRGGASWDQIGRFAGTTRQAAHERYGQTT